MTTFIDTMPVRDAILGRRSVRSYTPEKIDAPIVHELLAAAVRAPTAMHVEPWQFVIVQDRERLDRLSEGAKALLASEAGGHGAGHESLDFVFQPDFHLFYDAGTLVVICARTAGAFALADCWLAAENLMLAAYAMGLGTCVIGLSVAALNEPDVKRELGIPPETTAVAPIIVGWPRDEGQTSSRCEPEILAWR